MTVAAAQTSLTATRLDRVGAGCYRVVFGSRSWVVKIERSYRSSVATIMAVQLVTTIRVLRGRHGWRRDRRVPGLAMEPGSVRARSRAFMRLALVGLLRVCLAAVPEALWRATRAAREVRQAREFFDRRGPLLPRLEGSGLLIPHLQLPATRVRAFWGRRFTVTAAYRRVDPVLSVQLRKLARQGRHGDIDALLTRFLDYQVQLWRRGVFTWDIVPFVNYGLHDGKVVLLDDGSLTDDPLVIREALAAREAWLTDVEETLRALTSPEHAARFREGLGRLLTVSAVRRHWPTPQDPRWDDLEGGDLGPFSREKLMADDVIRGHGDGRPISRGARRSGREAVGYSQSRRRTRPPGRLR